jgi:GntR family transcriptional regulator
MAPNGNALDQLDTRLLAARARAEILSAILDGRFERKLPNEDRLAEMLNVSRTTVRTALQGLERDGVVTRQRAIGTIINPHVRASSLALQRLAGFDMLLKERGHEVRVDISGRWGPAGEWLAEAFPALEAGAECFLTDKRYRADGQLALAIVDAVSREQFVDPAFEGDVQASLFDFSERHCRAAIHHAVVQIVPMVQVEEATVLAIPDGTPFIRLHETHYSVRGDIVAYSVIDIDDRYIRLDVVRTR